MIVDSLRADAVYENWVRTPTMDALARQGLRFTNVFPEGMPTVPARNAILSGRRQFPFRGWYDRPGLIEAPGWEPLDHVDASFLSVLRRAGWWTAYVTDNPFLGYAPPYGRFRGSVNRFVRTGGQIGGHQPVSSVPKDVLRHWLYPANDDPRTRRRVGLYLANSRPWESPDNTFAGRVFRNAIHELNQAAAQKGPFALVVDTYEPHEPWTPPARFLDRYGGWDGREPAMPQYGRAATWLERQRARPGREQDARPLRRRGDDDRPLARHAHRPPPRARPRARDGDRARGGPRHPARRARLDREGPDRPLPLAHPGAR